MRRDRENDSALEQALCRLYQSEEPPAGFETGWRAAVRREESSMRIKKTETTGKRNLWRAVAPVCAAVVLVAGSLWAGTLEPGLNADGGAPQVVAKRAGGTPNAMMSSSADMADYNMAVSDEAAAYGAPEAAQESGGTAEQSAQKLVRTASLTLRTTAFDGDLEKVKALLQSMDGYVEDFYQYGDVQSGDTRTASLRVRVPAERLDAFLSGVEGVGRVTDRSESTTDMTVQYVDQQARLDTLYAKMERLQQLMSKAEEVADLIELESAIADTQYEIDRYETSQRSIDRRVEMSEVSVTLMEESSAQSAAAADVSLGERLSAALSASVRWLGSFLRNMLVFLTMALPVAVPVGAVVLAAWLIVRRRRAKKTGEE